MPKFFINVKEKGAKKAAGNIKSLTGSMKMMALQAVSVTAVVAGLRKSIQMSAEMEGVGRGFDNLAKSSGFSTGAFNKFKAATDGTVGSLELMKQANNAMLLGITDSEDQMANMFDVAQRLGQSLGLDTVQAVESLVTGLGRQSKLMLDNLGIMVNTQQAYDNYAASIGKTSSQLTDQERKTAFTNAAMKEANSLVAQLGEEQLSTKDSINQVATAAGDLAIKFGDVLAPAVQDVASFLVDIIENTQAFLEWADGVNTADEAQEKFNERMDSSQKLIDDISKRFGITTDSTTDFITQMSVLTTQLSIMSANDFFQGTINPAINAQRQLRIETERLKEAMVGQIENSPLVITSLDDLSFNAGEYLSKLEKIPEAQNSVSEAQLKAIADSEKLKNERKDETKNAISNLQNIASAPGWSQMEKVAKRAAQTQALVDAYASANAAFKAMAGIPVVGPGLGAAAYAAALASGIATVKKIESAATGADFVTSGPQMMMVGDNPSGQERVQVTPLGGDPNLEGPQGGGGAITLNISAPLVDDTVVDSIIPAIREAIRRGEDIGIS